MQHVCALRRMMFSAATDDGDVHRECSLPANSVGGGQMAASFLMAFLEGIKMNTTRARASLHRRTCGCAIAHMDDILFRTLSATCVRVRAGRAGEQKNYCYKQPNSSESRIRDRVCVMCLSVCDTVSMIFTCIAGRPS